MSRFSGMRFSTPAVDSATYRPDDVSGASITHSTDQTLPDGTWTTVTFDIETFDTDNFHDTGTNPSRLTVQKSGMHRVGATIRLNGNATGYRAMRLVVNGGTAVPIGYASIAPGSAVPVTFSIPPVLVDLVAGDYIEVQGYQNSGVSLIMQAINPAPRFEVERIGGTPF